MNILKVILLKDSLYIQYVYIRKLFVGYINMPVFNVYI